MAGVVGFTDFWIYGDGRGLKYFAESCALGACIPQLGNSTIICKNGGIAWLVAPISTEVSRTWYCRDDAVTTAGSITGLTTSAFSSTGWFVPCIGQLQTGYSCRSFWDSYTSSTTYWSSTEFGSGDACGVNFNTGIAGGDGKTYTRCVRAFRCVTY